MGHQLSLFERERTGVGVCVCAQFEFRPQDKYTEQKLYFVHTTLYKPGFTSLVLHKKYGKANLLKVTYPHKLLCIPLLCIRSYADDNEF